MRIGVISDSHDHIRLLQHALETLIGSGAQALLHAGDIIAPFAARLLAPPSVPQALPVHVIYGNNDGERAGLKKILPQITDGPLRLLLGGRTIVLAHDAASLKPSHVKGADAVISGHTHQVVNETRDGVLWLNPGECCGVLTGQATAAVLDTDTMTAQIIEITA